MRHLICSAALMLAIGTARTETLTVRADTDGPRKGVIAILVFDSKDGFPSDHDKAALKARFPVTAEGPVVCTITNLPYGEYSLSVLHDVNDNYKADKMFGLGPPKEPVGFSNISGKLKKRPAFEETLFTFGPGHTEQTVEVRKIF